MNRTPSPSAVVVGLLYVLSIGRRYVDPSEILVIFPTTAQSHYRAVRPLIHGLLDRGHRIVAVTNFPDRGAAARDNLSHVDISGLKPHSKFRAAGLGLTEMLSRVTGSADTYAAVLGHPPVAGLLRRPGRKFDLVIVEFFTTTPIFAPIAAAVDAPIIGFCPMTAFPWTHRLMGVPSTASYVPVVIAGSVSGDHASFVQRLVNLAAATAFDYLVDWAYVPAVRKINARHYGIRTASLTESLANISLVFTNNHYGTLMALPSVPGIVDVGGIHVVAEKPLSRDLDDFINEADHGVILFSLGSVVSEKSLGADKLNSIFEAFAKLEQRVIMKFDAESYETQPANVKMVKWFPQRDLLAHPKVLLFISHAGIMSVFETIHCGKPMVAIPIFGDQPFNANLLVDKQVAVTVDYSRMESDELFRAINEALTEDYRINAKKLQRIYNDRPQSPLETAIFWTEYIIRNKNESKELLKSPMIHLNFYQTYLIDVFVTFVTPIVMVMCIILWTIMGLRKYRTYLYWRFFERKHK